MVCSEAAMSQPVTGIFAELVNIGAVFGKDNDVVLDVVTSRHVQIGGTYFVGRFDEGNNFLILSVNLIPVPLPPTCLFRLLPHLLTVSS